MFEERRTKGIDKSYPLQPIHNTERAARKPLPNGYSKVTTSKLSVERKTSKMHTSISSHSVKKQQQHVSFWELFCINTNHSQFSGSPDYFRI